MTQTTHIDALEQYAADYLIAAYSTLYAVKHGSMDGAFRADADEFDRHLLIPPVTVRRAFRKGLALLERGRKEGFAGKGLEPATVREARAIARGMAITTDKLDKGYRFFQRNARFVKYPETSPAGVAWWLWGGAEGKRWFERVYKAWKAGERTDRLSKPVKSKPCPGGYRIPLTKKCRSTEALKHTIAHTAEHLGTNVTSWSMGKIVGGAIAQIGIAHGIPVGLSNQIAESGVQALSATVLHAIRKGNDRDPATLAQRFISEAAGAFAGKMAHTGWDDAILGGDDELRMITAAIVGKGTGAATVATVSRTLKRQSQTLARVVDRLIPTFKRDAEESLTAAEKSALFDLTFAGLLLAREQGKEDGLRDRVSAIVTAIDSLLEQDNGT